MIHGLRPVYESPRATSSRTNQSVSAAAFSARLANAIFVSRQRAVEREIARYLQNSKFTDEAEREIERRFFSTR